MNFKIDDIVYDRLEEFETGRVLDIGPHNDVIVGVYDNELGFTDEHVRAKSDLSLRPVLEMKPPF